MKITQIVPASPGHFENKTGNTDTTGNYKIGQLLDARVLANSSQGQVSLRLGGVDVLASTKVPLQQNATLSLKVIQLQPRLLLQVLTASVYNPLQEAKLNLLPRQSSMAPLLAELIHKTSTKEVTMNQSSQKSAGQLLVAALFGRNEIKRPGGLQKAIRESGLFLEANLAAQKPAASSDLKILLLRYLSTLAKTQRETLPSDLSRMLSAISLPDAEVYPPLKGRLPIRHPIAKFNEAIENPDNQRSSLDLIKKIEGAVARIGLLQVATLDSVDEGLRIWQLEIPLRHGDTVETVSLTIEKEQTETAGDEAESERWAVNLSLDLPQLGALQCRINNDVQGISTTFWSDSTKTLSVLESRLFELRASFERIGLQIHNVNYRQGQQPLAASLNTEYPAASPLIDIQI